MTLQIAKHKSAAMKIDQHAHRWISFGRVNARRDLTGRARDMTILDPIDRFKRNRIGGEQCLHLGSRLLGRFCAQEHWSGCVERIEQDFHLRIEDDLGSHTSLLGERAAGEAERWSRCLCEILKLRDADSASRKFTLLRVVTEVGAPMRPEPGLSVTSAIDL